MIELKSEAEIDLMRQAGHIAALAREAAVQAVKPGVTTQELDAIAEEVIRSHGAVPSFKGYHGFPATICASINEQVVHGIPSDRSLQSGDIISIDVGAIFQGFHGDTAETVAVGEVTQEALQLIDVTRKSLEVAIEKVVIGNRLSDISHAVWAYVNPFGYGIVHDFVGHGIGRALHEEPQIPNWGPKGRGPILRRGMVLAVEPMINLGTASVRVLKDGWTAVTQDGRPSAHFEHTIAVGDVPEVLTYAES